jgi:hypothetical protein
MHARALACKLLQVLIQKSGNPHVTNIADTQLMGVLDGLGTRTRRPALRHAHMHS